jgi:hypothetical protein
MVKDAQVKGLFSFMSRGKPLYVSAERADMCENTARRYVGCGRLPSEMRSPHTWRTRPDPFQDIWPDVEQFLSNDGGLEAKAAFGWLQRTFPGRFQDGQVRTLQRRFRRWRALRGKAKEVFFPQNHYPGELGASDFTAMDDLGITIAGARFEHLLYHFVLTYSNWETATVCFSESFESLNEGLQNALWRLGGVVRKHRTDCLTAAVNNLKDPREFTGRYAALMRHYDIEAVRTNPNSGNENGDIEQRHYRFKKAVEQELILRGSRDFTERREYQAFILALEDRLNRGRASRFEEERKLLRPLPSMRLPVYTELNGLAVSPASTIVVRKNIYSVHSRLRDLHVDVRLNAEHLDVYFEKSFVERIPRLHGTDGHRINYRHVIDWLVRKPGAFANYRYRADLFPTSHFRVAYDMLRRWCAVQADREYVKILHHAASESEELVNEVLRRLVDEQQLPRFATVTALCGWLKHNRDDKAPAVRIDQVDLSAYDSLISQGEAAL